MTPDDLTVIEQRRKAFSRKRGEAIQCEKQSVAGGMSQRACVFCGSRVVLYPIADAVHLIHGPIGCAAYTWDIRGALSSGPELHRLSFSTDLREKDVIYGGESRLEAGLIELIERHQPKAAFVYNTCIVGLIGDDVEAICKAMSARYGIPVLTVAAPGFAGTKKTGYQVACDALAKLVGTGSTAGIGPKSINILGDFNLAGETWMIREYYERMGVEVVATITGDGRIDDIRRCHGAQLNVVQCSGSMTGLAKHLRDQYHRPFLRVSYFGLEDTAQALYDVAKHFNDDAMLAKAQELVREEIAAVWPRLKQLRERLRGKSAAIYTGGAFKAISLVRALRSLGMRTVLAGSQTGTPEDYEILRELCDDGTTIVDDIGARELSRFLETTPTDLLIGGVKERPIAFKLGVAFCDHNHERKHALAGFQGMLNFAEEVYASVCSPVWELMR
ncbi:MAG: nitrogenase iron-molybdenum cofactor biosynthesis protein NifE [Planctomycetota bacterium]